MAIQQKATATIHFMDGSKLNISYPRLSGRNSPAIANAVGKAIEDEKLAIATSSKLLIIPTCNIKFIEVSPVPDSLPETVLRDAEIS